MKYLLYNVDGRWSRWSPYGGCSRSCGGGFKTRTRVCNNPKPKNGGAPCRGPPRETARCNRQICGKFQFCQLPFAGHQFSLILFS